MEALCSPLVPSMNRKNTAAPYAHAAVAGRGGATTSGSITAAITQADTTSSGCAPIRSVIRPLSRAMQMAPKEPITVTSMIASSPMP